MILLLLYYTLIHVNTDIACSCCILWSHRFSADFVSSPPPLPPMLLLYSAPFSRSPSWFAFVFSVCFCLLLLPPLSFLDFINDYVVVESIKYIMACRRCSEINWCLNWMRCFFFFILSILLGSFVHVQSPKAPTTRISVLIFLHKLHTLTDYTMQLTIKIVKRLIPKKKDLRWIFESLKIFCARRKRHFFETSSNYEFRSFQRFTTFVALPDTAVFFLLPRIPTDRTR